MLLKGNNEAASRYATQLEKKQREYSIKLDHIPEYPLPEGVNKQLTKTKCKLSTGMYNVEYNKSNYIVTVTNNELKSDAKVINLLRKDKNNYKMWGLLICVKNDKIMIDNRDNNETLSIEH